MTPIELREWRTVRGLSWSRAAALVEVHPRTWAKWERAERKIPRWLPKVLSTLEKENPNG